MGVCVWLHRLVLPVASFLRVMGSAPLHTRAVVCVPSQLVPTWVAPTPGLL